MLSAPPPPRPPACPAVAAGEGGPACPAVAAGEGWAPPRPPPAAVGALDGGVEDVRALPGDVDRDSSERAVRDAVALHPRPRVAAVGRLPDAAARAAAVHAARGAAPLVGGCVDDLAVRRVHRQIVRSGVVVDLQHLLPGLAAVGGLVDAALTARSPQAARRRDEDDVVVARVDGDAMDVLGGPEAHVDVGLAPVGRLVDAVAPRGALAVVRFAGAHPHQVGVRLRDGDVANRHQALILELGRERRAGVRGLPDTAVGGAHVEDGRIRLVDGKVRDAAGHRRRADLAEMERVERPAGRGCGRLRCLTDERLPGDGERERHAERNQQMTFHQKPPGGRSQRRWPEMLDYIGTARNHSRSYFA